MIIIYGVDNRYGSSGKFSPRLLQGYQPQTYQPLAPTGVHDLGYQPGVLSTLRVAGFRAINPVSYQPGVLSRVASGAYQPGALSTRGPINPGAYQPMGQTEF